MVAADDNSDGFGLIIDPAPAAGANERGDPNPAGYAERDIRFLGPRQTCSHLVEVTAAAAMLSDGGTAQAWYRMASAGAHQTQPDGTRLIYPDQGLNIMSEGIVFSEAIEIAPSA